MGRLNPLRDGMFCRLRPENVGRACAEKALRAAILLYSIILYNVQVEGGKAVRAGKLSRVQFSEIIQTTF